MTDMLQCPSCGASIPAGSESCANCNFPLAEDRSARPPKPATPAAEATPPKAPAPERPVRVERPLPHRPRKRAPNPLENQSTQLWLWIGGLSVVLLLGVALQSTLFKKPEQAPQTQVAGSSAAQKEEYDRLVGMLTQDSTNVDARNRIADILFDTANWNEAMIQYKSVVRQDSSRVPAIVDLGVCYFNLGDQVTAERLFQLALSKDPTQPIAWFNMGIVAEQKNDPEGAMRYYHKAIENNPPTSMQQPLAAAMQRLQQKLGRTPPPLERPAAP